MNAEQVEQRFHELEQQKVAGEIDFEQFKAEVRKLQFRDGQGRLWRLLLSGQWCYEEEECWVLGEPPRELKGFAEAAAEPVSSPSQTERQALEGELARRRRNLATLEERAAKYGIDVPLYLVNQIDDEKTRISEIVMWLSGARDDPSLAAQYFAEGTRAFIIGDLWEARRYYEMTLSEDPFYPRAREQLVLTQEAMWDERAYMPSRTRREDGWDTLSDRACVAIVLVLVVLGFLIGIIIYQLRTTGWLF